jgi:hypothetical protein
MLRKGYVETQIEVLSKALASILLRRNEGDYNAAITELRFAGQKMTGFDPTVLAALADEALVDLFWFNKKFDGAKCYMAGRLLAEQGESYVGMRRTRLAEVSFHKARILLMEALINEDILRKNDVIDQIASLTSRVQDEVETHSGLRRNFRYFDALGNYARAEDCLFEFKSDNDQDWKKEAEEFYARLLALPDDQLDRGGLPREEIINALDEIRA